MAELADEPIAMQAPRGRKSAGFRATLRKRWRAWLRAVHRDVGYLAVGFTVIYALSGIAMNHVDDWNYNYNASERSLQIAPVPDDATDAQAAKLVADAAGLAQPDTVFRAGDEVRLEYGNGTKVTAIGDAVTVHEVRSRFFFRAATWLHAAKGKTGWKYIADAYAILLLYLAFSGLLMIKGKLGLKWRGMVLVAVGFAVPITYLLLTGGPEAQKPESKLAVEDKLAPGDGIRLLPPDDEPAPDEPAAPDASDGFERPPIRKPPPPGE